MIQTMSFPITKRWKSPSGNGSSTVSVITGHVLIGSGQGVGGLGGDVGEVGSIVGSAVGANVSKGGSVVGNAPGEVGNEVG